MLSNNFNSNHQTMTWVHTQKSQRPPGILALQMKKSCIGLTHKDFAFTTILHIETDIWLIFYRPIELSASGLSCVCNVHVWSVWCFFTTCEWCHGIVNPWCHLSNVSILNVWYLLALLPKNIPISEKIYFSRYCKYFQYWSLPFVLLLHCKVK